MHSMSTEPLSRSNQIVELSLADVLITVQKADLPERRRQEIASALRTVGRALGKDLGRIPADPRRLAPILKDVSPLAIGISQPRWNNIRSLVRSGLSMVRPVSPGRHLNKLSANWQSLWVKLPSMRLRRALSRFLRFCSASRIEPEAVTEREFTAYQYYLTDSLLKRQAKLFRATGR